MAIVICLAGLLVAGPATAQQDPAADQRVVRLTAEYKIQPDRGRIEVVEQISVSNVKGSQRSGSTVTSFFWTGHTVWVPSDAEDLTIEVGGEALEYEVADTVSGVDILGVEYRRNLTFGQTRLIDVTYTLPTYTPGTGTRRINKAFFDVELLICCNYEEVDLTISMPESFEVDPPTSLSFSRSSSGGNQVYTFADNEVTGQFTDIIFTEWFGLDETGLEVSAASIGSANVDIVTPPDDVKWAEDTAELVTDLGESLETLTGSPWPLSQGVFQQGPNDDFGPWGYAGPFDGPIQIPRDYDDRALAATMAQAWLTSGPFDDPLIRNGLAADLGSEALNLATGTSLDPSEPNGTVNNTDGDGAFWVIRQVSDDIGYDGMRDLLAMAENGETAYVGEGPAESVATIPSDWRRFIDLAELRLGSDRVVTVFNENVLDSDQIELLGARSRVLSTYETVESRADGIAPVGLRTAMTNWDFGRAQTLLTSANQVLDEHDRVVSEAEARGQDPNLNLGELWASAESPEDLAAVKTTILDREQELTQSALWKSIFLGFLGLIVVAGIALGAFLLYRNNKIKNATA